MKVTYLNTNLRDEIIKEICSDYKFTSPEVYAERVREIANKHMTEDEKDMLKTLHEISEVFPVCIESSAFYLSRLDNYLAGNVVVVPKRLRVENSSNYFLLEARSIGEEAKQTRLDKSKLTSAVRNCDTVHKFRRNLPQFVKYMDIVIKRASTTPPAEVLDTTFLDKYKAA